MALKRHGHCTSSTSGPSRGSSRSGRSHLSAAVLQPELGEHPRCGLGRAVSQPSVCPLHRGGSRLRRAFLAGNGATLGTERTHRVQALLFGGLAVRRGGPPSLQRAHQPPATVNSAARADLPGMPMVHSVLAHAARGGLGWRGPGRLMLRSSDLRALPRILRPHRAVRRGPDRGSTSERRQHRAESRGWSHLPELRR